MAFKIFVAIVVILGALAAFVATRPTDFAVTRSATYAAPSAAVFAQVNELKKWEAWSPWAKRDPQMKQTYDGPAAGPGSTTYWTGNKDVGEGRMTIGFLAMGAGGFAWGALSDRIGPRLVVLAGAVLLGLGLFLASRAQNPLQFQLGFGLLVGFAVGSFFSPMIAAVMGWMTEHRGLAVALVSVGVGLAPMTMSPLAAWLITQMDWRAAQVVLAVLVWATLVPVALFVRRPPAAQAGTEGAGEAAPLRLRDAFVSVPFIVMAATFFACCAAHAGPIFHTITYAMTCGVAPLAAVTIYSVEGLAGLGGRLAFGVAADRLGVKRVLIAGLLVQALAAGAFIYASRLGGFHAVAPTFGFAYGGGVALSPGLAPAYLLPR